MIVGIAEMGCSKKEFEFLVAPQDIEVSSHDNRPLRCFYQFIQLLELALSVVIGQGEVDEENSQACCFGLNGKPFDAFFEKMKLMIKKLFLAQESIALFGKDRNSSGQGAATVF